MGCFSSKHAASTTDSANATLPSTLFVNKSLGRGGSLASPTILEEDVSSGNESRPHAEEKLNTGLDEESLKEVKTLDTTLAIQSHSNELKLNFEAIASPTNSAHSFRSRCKYIYNNQVYVHELMGLDSRLTMEQFTVQTLKQINENLLRLHKQNSHLQPYKSMRIERVLVIFHGDIIFASNSNFRRTSTVLECLQLYDDLGANRTLRDQLREIPSFTFLTLLT